jgi:transposase
MHDISEQALNIFFQFPVINVTQLSTHLKKSYNTANTIIQRFIETGILTINKSQQRNKLYRFDQYLNLLEKEY